MYIQWRTVTANTKHKIDLSQFKAHPPRQGADHSGENTGQDIRDNTNSLFFIKHLFYYYYYFFYFIFIILLYRKVLQVKKVQYNRACLSKITDFQT